MRVRILAATITGALLAALTPAAAAIAYGEQDGPFCAISVSEAGSMLCADSADELSQAWGEVHRARDTQILIARFYDNANYNTDAGFFEIYAGGDCTVSGSNIDWQMSDLSSWRDRISSFKSFGNCATRLWSATNFGGTAYPSSTGWLASSSYVGATFNDRARSAQFS